MATQANLPIDATAADVLAIIGGASEAAAPWYNAVSFGLPVAPIPSNQTQAALMQEAIQQQQQQALLAVPGIGPLLSGLLANPTLLIALLGIILVGVILAVREI